MSNSTQTKFSKKEKILYILCGIIFFVGVFMEGYIKFNSVVEETKCGKVVNIYEKSIGRGMVTFFDLVSYDSKVQQFAYVDTGGISLWFRSLFDTKAKDNVKLIEHLKIGTTLCVTYSLKYREGSVLHARPETPYIFTIELSNVTK